MTRHKHEHPEFSFDRPKKVSRLPQCNKSNRIARRYYAGARHRVLTQPVAAAAAAA